MSHAIIPRESSRTSGAEDAQNALAIESLYRAHHAALTKFLERRLPDPTIAADLVQSIFISFVGAVTTTQIENVASYLFECAQNRLADYYRSEERRRRCLEAYATTREASDASDGPEDAVVMSEQFATLTKIVRRMPAKRRDVFLMSKVHDIPNAKIAELLGMSNDAVKKHIARALCDCHSGLSWLSAGAAAD